MNKQDFLNTGSLKKFSPALKLDHGQRQRKSSKHLESKYLKNLMRKKHTTSIARGYTYFKLYAAFCSLLLLTKDFFLSQGCHYKKNKRVLFKTFLDHF